MNDFEIYNTKYNNLETGRWILNTAKWKDPLSNLVMTDNQTHYNTEISHMLKIVESLPNDAVIIDGGANLGAITIPLATFLKGTNATIISFEAQRRVFYALAGSIALNDLYNVFAYHYALGEAPAVAKMPEFSYHHRQELGSTAIVAQHNQSYNYIEQNNVQVITIDSLNLNRVDFIKLDIEGYEPQALRGGIETIKAHRPWLWIEYNDCEGTLNQHIIKEIIESVGNYTCYYLTCDNQNMICVPEEKRTGVNLDFIKSPI